jgi:hypothetical protein
MVSCLALSWLFLSVSRDLLLLNFYCELPDFGDGIDFVKTGGSKVSLKISTVAKLELSRSTTALLCIFLLVRGSDHFFNRVGRGLIGN